MLFATMNTLYSYIISNCCFAGESNGLPVEVARRVFELVVFDGAGDSSLSNIIVLTLAILPEKICSLDCAERFHYVGHGVFLQDVFTDRDLFD